MGVGTNVRAGRLWRTLLAAQTAKGTPLDDLSTATQAWAAMGVADLDGRLRDPEWWYSHRNGNFTASRYPIKRLARGVVEAHASHALLLVALQSIFGTYASPNFTLVGYVNKWLTLACVEDKSRSNTSTRVVRFADAMVPRLELTVDSAGEARVAIHYAAEVGESRALSALSGWTLPAAPMDTTDRDVFAGRTATLTRDPSGANVAMPFEQVSVALDVNLEPYWDYCGPRERAIRRGPLDVRLTLVGKPSDEQWQATLDAIAGTRQTYRLTLPDAASGHTFTATFSNVTFNRDPLTLADQEYEAMTSHGQPTTDGTNFVSLSLT